MELEKEVEMNPEKILREKRGNFPKTNQSVLNHPTENSSAHKQFTPDILRKSFRTQQPIGAIQSTAKPKIANPLIDKGLKRFSGYELSGLEHVEGYLRALHRRNCRPNTIRCNVENIRLFLVFLKEKRDTCLETVTRDDLGAFIENEQDRGMRPRTVNTRLKALSAFLRYLIDREIVHPDVLKRRMMIKIPESLPRAIDPDDVKHILRVIKKPRDRAMILVLLRTGMRIGELLSTKVKDLNLKEKTIEIYEAEKTRVGRVVYLSDDALRALKAWLKERDPRKEFVFYATGRNIMRYPTARKMFIKYLENVSLTENGYTLHCLRHTFASELLNAGMRLECLQQLLGHQSIEVTRRYAQLTDQTRREEYFRAMAIIERGEIHGHYRFYPPVPKVSEEEKLLGQYHQGLHEHP